MRNWRWIISAAICASLPTHSAQVPFEFLPREWDLDTAADVDSTAQLVFDNVASLLQHWPNTRYRNGHTIVPGIIPVGMNLYHGRSDEHIPTIPEWVATDPEHSLLFCHPPCWHLTLQTTRVLNVLYFDGSSAAKTDSGSLDSQDILLWGEVIPNRTHYDRERIIQLCEWGQPFGVDGYLRMEMDFEIMLCNFTNGVSIASFLHLSTFDTDLHRAPLPGEPLSLAAFEVLHAGSWHNHNPGDTRIKLDLTRLVSFYDPSLAPSLIGKRRKQKRWQHRLEGLSDSDGRTFMSRLTSNLKSQELGSGIDWLAVMRAIMNRLSGRLELLQYILDGNSSSTSFPTTHERAVLAQAQLRAILQPYILNATVPPLPRLRNSKNNTWLQGPFRSCAHSHTSFVSDEVVLSTLTASEHLVLSAILGTKREICRVITKMWGEGVLSGIDKVLTRMPPDIDVEETLRSWRKDLDTLMEWLDWSVWVKCVPQCNSEEMCYMPTWPFSQPQTRRRPWPGRRPTDPSLEPTTGLLSGPSDEEQDWDLPKPKCIRRMEPYSV